MQQSPVSSDTAQLANNDGHCLTLWIGDIEPYMDEEFIKNAFAIMGEPVESSKVMRDRQTRTPSGYGFVSFYDENSTHRALYKLNRKPIPNCQYGKKFKLNYAVKNDASVKHYYIFVEGLQNCVDNVTFKSVFKAKYPSVLEAKIVADKNGEQMSVGYVKFSNEHEYKAALSECQNSTMFGSKKVHLFSVGTKNKLNVSIDHVPSPSESVPANVYPTPTPTAYYNVCPVEEEYVHACCQPFDYHSYVNYYNYYVGYYGFIQNPYIDPQSYSVWDFYEWSQFNQQNQIKHNPNFNYNLINPVLHIEPSSQIQSIS